MTSLPTHSPTRLARLAKVGLGVVLACTAAGAVAGVLTYTVVVAAGGFVDDFGGAEMLTLAANVGAICGAVLGPIAFFGFLRRVPLGKLFGQTTVGTIAGALLGSVVRPSAWLTEPLLWGAAGFFAAALRLAYVYRKRD